NSLAHDFRRGRVHEHAGVACAHLRDPNERRKFGTLVADERFAFSELLEMRRRVCLHKREGVLDHVLVSSELHSEVETMLCGKGLGSLPSRFEIWLVDPENPILLVRIAPRPE